MVEQCTRVLIGVLFGVFLTLGGQAWFSRRPPDRAVAQQDSPAPDPTWKAGLETLQGKLPSQANAMMDVSYHFSNLWFAAQEGNWSLADFYLRETRSHLCWAVRILPIRKDSQGEEVDLGGILESIENAQLVWMEEAVAKRDAGRFEQTYRLTMEACYACHKAAGKPFLRLKGPDRPPETMVQFSPEAEGAE